MADVGSIAAASPGRLSPFQGFVSPGRLGASEGSAGLTVSERTGLALATLIARRGADAALADAVRSALGIELPETPRAVHAEGLAAVWSGPGQWLVVADRGSLAGAPDTYPGTALTAALTGPAAGLAAVVDHTDARGVLRVSGPRARETLMKGVGIDLHPRAFGPGVAAMTRCGLIDVTLWQVDGEPTYDIAVARGFAGSFWHWLEESAAEYGIAVV